MGWTIGIGLALALGSQIKHQAKPAEPTVVINGIPNNPLNDRLSDAVRASDVAKVKRLLKMGADPNGAEAGWKPLDEIDVRNGSCFEIASLLLRRGARINDRAAQMVTPLTSNWMLNSQYAKFLLDHGADPNEIGFAGRTPLHEAVMNRDLTTVKLLISRRADVNKRSIGVPGERLVDSEHLGQPNYRDSGETPMFGLAEGWSVQIYQALLWAGADAAAEDDNGWTLLESCVFDNNRDAVAYLLKHGAAPNQKSKEGYTSLHLAMSSLLFPDPEIVRLLLASGADPSIRNKNGKTAEDLLRSRTDNMLRSMRTTVLDASGKAYLAAANKILQMVHPGAPSLILPTIDTAQWSPLGDGQSEKRYRVERAADKTILRIHIDPADEPCRLTLSHVFLDWYESDLPGPFVYAVPSNQPFETVLAFPPAAGGAGALSLSLSTEGKTRSEQMGGDDASGPMAPSLTWSSTDDLEIGNPSPDRTMEVVVDEENRGKTKTKSNLHLTIGPGESKSHHVPGLGSFGVLYRWRLLPNKRWLSGKQQF